MPLFGVGKRIIDNYTPQSQKKNPALGGALSTPCLGKVEKMSLFEKS
jgi:hypothetical protein